MNRTKEMTKLVKHAIRVIEQDAIEVSQSEPVAIGSVMVVSSPDANAFSQSVFNQAAEMQKQGMVKVEIQYSTSSYQAPTGSLILMHSALLIGRKYENPSNR